MLHIHWLKLIIERKRGAPEVQKEMTHRNKEGNDETRKGMEQG